MARAKVKLADNIARVVFIETEATIGATLGRDLKLPDGTVATAATLRNYLGVAAASDGTTATHHRLLQGLNLGDDHPQYTRKDTLTTRGDLYVRGLTSVTRLGLGTTNQLLRSNGTDPTWVTISPVITLGTDLSGSVTLTNLGNGTLNATIANDAVTNGKLRNSTGLSVIGRSAGTTGDPADITAANDLEVLRRSGGTLGFGVLDSTFISNFNEATQDAVAGILTDSDTIDWTYDDTLNVISAEVTIPPLDEEVAPVAAADYVMVYSAAAGGNVKVLLDNLPGGGGGGSLAYVNVSVPGGNTVANTVTETAFASTYTIPANALQQASVINVKAAGVYSTDATPPTVRIRVKLGSTTILDSGVVTLLAVTDSGWWLDGQAAIFAAGGSGSLDAQGLFVLNTGSGTSLAINLENTAAISIDTTANQAVTITVEWGTADADNTITMRQMAIWLADALDPIAKTFTKGATFVNASAALSVPVNDVPVNIPIDCIISKVRIFTTGGTGSCVLDIWADIYGNFPPTVADSICASAKPTISSGVKYEDSTLTGWTTQLSAGDVLFFHLESTSTFKTIAIVLELDPT